MGYRDFISGPKRPTQKSIVRRGLIIKELHMGQADSVVAVFADHLAAEAAWSAPGVLEIEDNIVVV